MLYGIPTINSMHYQAVAKPCDFAPFTNGQCPAVHSQKSFGHFSFWNQNCFFGRDTARYHSFQSTSIDSGCAGPVYQCFSLTVGRDKDAVGFVVRLLSVGSPPTVTRFIISPGIRKSINRMVWRRFRPHIFEKRSERFLPSIANRDSPINVKRVVFAPTTHRSPRTKFIRIFVPSVFCSQRRTASALVSSTLFASVTSVSSEITSCNLFDDSARAFTVPTIFSGIAQNRPFTKLLPSNVLEQRIRWHWGCDQFSHDSDLPQGSILEGTVGVNQHPAVPSSIPDPACSKIATGRAA